MAGLVSTEYRGPMVCFCDAWPQTACRQWIIKFKVDCKLLSEICIYKVVYTKWNLANCINFIIRWVQSNIMNQYSLGLLNKV